MLLTFDLIVWTTIFDTDFKRDSMSNLKATVEIRCLRASTHHKIITSGIIERKQVFLRSNFSHCLCGEFKQTHYGSSTQGRTLLHHTLFCQLFYGLGASSFSHVWTYYQIIKRRFHFRISLCEWTLNSIMRYNGTEKLSIGSSLSHFCFSDWRRKANRCEKFDSSSICLMQIFSRKN